MTKPKQRAIKLNGRQRTLLLAGLELLRKQLASEPEETPDGTLLSAKQLGELAAIVGGNWDGAASHKHAIDGGRDHSYDVAGECSVHGMICVACEIKWHLEDGPLGWCRDAIVYWRVARKCRKPESQGLGLKVGEDLKRHAARRVSVLI